MIHIVFISVLIFISQQTQVCGILYDSRCIIPPQVCPNENITFWLYTSNAQQNPHKLSVDEPDTILNADFIPNVPTVVLIHGYTGDKDGSPNSEIRPAYFTHGDYNIISVDYAPLAMDPCYIQAALNVPLVGNCTAQLIDRVVDIKTIPLESFHIVGFSLGGQVSGAISNWLQSGKLDRITGLDPALPLFATMDNSRKLDSNDAKFVDIIHTDALQRGKLEASGHVDFYVNGGMAQPRCEQQTEMSPSSCNHVRAPIYFAESINSDKGFWGRKCPSWTNYVLGLCKFNGDDHEEIMGEYTPDSARGIYFVDTNDRSPYAKGPKKDQDPNSEEETPPKN